MADYSDVGGTQISAPTAQGSDYSDVGGTQLTPAMLSTNRTGGSAFPAPPPSEDESKTQAVLQGLGMGATLGFLPQLGAARMSAQNALAQGFSGEGFKPIPGMDYNSLVKAQEEQARASMQAHPLEFFGGNIVGAGPLTATTAGGGALAQVGKMSTLGAIQGASQAYDEQGNPIPWQQRMSSAGVGGVLGGFEGGLGFFPAMAKKATIDNTISQLSKLATSTDPADLQAIRNIITPKFIQDANAGNGMKMPDVLAHQVHADVQTKLNGGILPDEIAYKNFLQKQMILPAGERASDLSYSTFTKSYNPYAATGGKIPINVPAAADASTRELAFDMIDTLKAARDYPVYGSIAPGYTGSVPDQVPQIANALGARSGAPIDVHGVINGIAQYASGNKTGALKSAFNAVKGASVGGLNAIANPYVNQIAAQVGGNTVRWTTNAYGQPVAKAINEMAQEKMQPAYDTLGALTGNR